MGREGSESGGPGGGGALRSSLEHFMERIAEIAPRRERGVSPASHLVADLGFDSLAYARLALLLYERYGVGAIGVDALAAMEDPTVEAFHRAYVLGPGPARG